jgi:prepilin-type N-terminal cleavage/methylation domain-containing protein
MSTRRSFLASRRHVTAGSRVRARRGLTLVEVIIAIAILATATLAFGRFMAKFAHDDKTVSVRSTANDLIADRINTIRNATNYGNVGGYAATEASIPNYPGFTRQTYTQRVGGNVGDIEDHQIVTVVVSGGGLVAPVKKTTIIGAF